MPRGNGTGPAGMGSMTGRAAGYCAGYSAPGFANATPGRGFGRALGLGFRGGRGWGRDCGMPNGAPAYPLQAEGPTPGQEADILKGQADRFETALEGIKKRLAELELKAVEAKK